MHTENTKLHSITFPERFGFDDFVRSETVLSRSLLRTEYRKQM